jgi:riboflavin kinase/FMN adenylyltransferase
MKIIYSLKRIKKYRRPVVALGVFDGLHLAHRRILKEAVKLSRKIKGTSIAITFWPHPQKKKSLYSLEHRLRLIAEIGLDACIVIKFNQAFSKISAEDFIKDILVDKIGAKYICVGKNFRFGRNAKGDSALLRNFSRRYGFKLKLFGVIKINRQPISSTYIRGLINRGNLKTAQELLGRPVSVLGTVIKGGALGRRLGVPTANINPHHEIVPPSGVYAVRIIFNHRQLKGACYIGKKPTFKRKGARQIEVHIFNFHKNIYRRYLEIQFIRKIRNERKFSCCASLVARIKKDICLAKRVISLP